MPKERRLPPCELCQERPATHAAGGGRQGPRTHCAPCAYATRGCAVAHRQRFDPAAADKLVDVLEDFIRHCYVEKNLVWDDHAYGLARTTYFRRVNATIQDANLQLRMVRDNRRAWIEAQVDTNTIADDPDFIERFLAPPEDVV